MAPKLSERRTIKGTAAIRVLNLAGALAAVLGAAALTAFILTNGGRSRLSRLGSREAIRRQGTGVAKKAVLKGERWRVEISHPVRDPANVQRVSRATRCCTLRQGQAVSARARGRSHVATANRGSDAPYQCSTPLEPPSCRAIISRK